MLTDEDLICFRKQLTKRRDEVFESHSRLRDDRRELLEQEVEFQERAQKDGISEPLAKMDEQEEEELEAIENALGKIEAGGFGTCESCGREIERERLNALPWAALCIRCAKRAKKGRGRRGRPEGHAASGLPPDLQGLSDGDMERYVLGELEEDGRVDLDELTIGSRKGVVRLGGFLPSEEQRRILMEILLDTMGLRDVADEIEIDPLLWETMERAPGRNRPGEEDEGETPEEEETSDAYTSQTSGAPLTPPDELIPEDHE